ncbi:HlyD family secretion protein [Sutterella seckii]|uniref:HlyD family secretion protein n=1 Tax=Sutterella seckii TaxID=1944635 RepID=A0A6I1EW25_9BURK|nr:biotin/lipoyl-binding protein [Sutterella seckii]KAB7656049.1 HlyD family secretion protein [Sutterella seckii]
MAIPQKQKRDILRTISGFAAAGILAAGLIFLGNRNDAVSEAERLKAGILTAHEVKAAFQSVGGRLVERPVTEGQRVRAGELLLGIDGTDIRISIEAQKAAIRQIDAQTALEEESIALALREADTNERTLWRQIEEAEASRKAAAASLESAKSDWTRAQNLYPRGAMAKSAYDQAKAAWIAAREALAISEHAVKRLSIGAGNEEIKLLQKTGSAEGMHLEAIETARRAAQNRKHNLENFAATRASLSAELEQLRVNETRLRIHAPENAKVLEVLYEKGELIGPNAPAVLLESERHYFDIYVSEKEIARFAEGTTVQCFSPALEKTLPGVVALAEAAPDFASLRMVRERGQADLTLFRVRIDVPPAEGLLPGMTLEVRL